MADNRKYLVLRAREIREMLPAEQQDYLLKLVSFMNQTRAAKNPDKPEPQFFVLNVADKYAVAAIEAYINAVDDDEMNRNNDGVQESRKAAVAARDYGIMRFDGKKLPG